MARLPNILAGAVRGIIEAPDQPRQQCDFRFRFKSCPRCNAENDIAARVCHQCQGILADPDDMLKAALRLKDAMVLRCAGMTLHTGQDSRGEWLKVIYYDEDGSEVSELFRLHTAAQRHIFELLFIRHHHKAPGTPLSWQHAVDLPALSDAFRYPDFIVARKKGHFWQIRHKVFDYQGRYRKANQLR